MLGTCNICDIRLDRKSLDDVQLIFKYDAQSGVVLVRDNRSESGTFKVNTNEALNPRSLYRFALDQPLKFQTGDIELQIEPELEPKSEDLMA